MNINCVYLFDFLVFESAIYSNTIQQLIIMIMQKTIEALDGCVSPYTGD